MASESVSVKGLILSSDEYKDKDRMLTVLTSDMGIIKVCAKGTGRPNSKTAFLSVPYMLCDFTLSDSHGFWYFKEGLIIESNSGIMNSLEAMAVAGHIADILAGTIYQTDSSKLSYELAVYAYYCLGRNPERYKYVYSAFNFYYLKISGLATTIVECSNCKTSFESFDYLFVNLNDTACYCGECAKVSKIRNNLFKVSKNAVTVFNYYLLNQVSSIFSINISEALIDEVYKFSTIYLSVHLDEKITDPIESLMRFQRKNS